MKNLLLFCTYICTYILFLFVVHNIYAEGTPQMRPTYGDGGFLHLLDPASTNDFAAYGATDERRIYFRINNINERVYIGFGRYKTRNMGNDGNINPVNEVLPLPNSAPTPQRELRFRIVDPGGTIVLAEQPVPVSGAGFIGAENAAAYNRCVAGPAQLVGAGGYHALMFTPATTGDFRIEFELYDIASNTVVTPAANRKSMLQLFDLTVATGVGGYTVTQTGADVNTGVVTSVAGAATATAIPGRLWSRAWSFNTGGFNVAYNGRVYPYSEDGVVTELNFNGMRPFGFVVSCNRDGLNTIPATPDNNFIVNRRSRPNLILPHTPLYRIFLQDPDNNIFPSGTVGCLHSATVAQCDQNSPYCINVTAQANGTVEVIIDLHPAVPDGIYTPGTRDVRLTAQFNTPGAPQTQCIPWDGLDGLGVQVPNGNITIIVNFQAGRTNLPIYDVENHDYGFIVRLVRPLTNACGNPVAPPRLYWDDVNIPASQPPATVGTPLDGLTNLAGCTPSPAPPPYPTPVPPPPNITGCHRFVGRNEQTINTWWYVAEDKVTIPFFNDNSLFDVGGLFTGPDSCTFVNGEFLDVVVTYSDAKFSLSNLSFTITPTLPGYSFANPITTNPVVPNAAANAPNGPQVVGNVLLGGSPVKRQITLRYLVQTSGTLNSIGYHMNVFTNACGSPQSAGDSIDCSAVLQPVVMSEFSGINQGNVNILNWATASEKDNKGFTIERSPDGNRFEAIGFVQGIGNSVSLRRYQYKDVLEVPQTFYYRLRQEDNDGTTTYSKMIALVPTDGQSNLANIYHDGKSAEIGIRTMFSQQEAATLNVYSLTGARISSQPIVIPAGSHWQYLSLPLNAKGIYIVEIYSQSGLWKRHKIVY
jgi:hypothetical protein